jgi:hypothetical protein
MLDNQLQAPSKIPKDIKQIKESAAPPAMAGVSGMEGMGGGTPGGVMGGILGGIGTGRRSSRQRPQEAEHLVRRHGRQPARKDHTAVSGDRQSGPHSGNRRFAGHDFQGRRDPKPQSRQRSSDAAASSPGCSPFLALQTISA